MSDFRGIPPKKNQIATVYPSGAISVVKGDIVCFYCGLQPGVCICKHPSWTISAAGNGTPLEATPGFFVQGNTTPRSRRTFGGMRLSQRFKRFGAK